MGHAAPRLRALLPAVLALLLVAPGAAAQTGAFAVDAVAFRAERGDGGRVDVHTEVPYAALRFTRRGSAFQARYTLTVTAREADRGGRPRTTVATQSWERSVTVGTYAETLGDGVDRAVHALALPPGRYVLDVEVEDGVALRAVTRRLEVEVPVFTAPVAMSDLLLTTRPGARGAEEPVVSGVLPVDGPPVALLYELYARQPERLRVRYVVRRPPPERRRGPIARLLGRGERAAGPPLIERAEWVAVEGGRTTAVFPLRVDRFGTGDFVVEVRVERADGRLLAERERAFTVRWNGLEDQLRDLDTAIAQLRYIARESEIRAMLEAPPAERLRLFRAFWDRRDPTPGSPRNERMEEYYYRVALANRHYRGPSAAGWATDRGEVFIRFGEPDRVETRPAPGGRTQQIWYYQRIGRRFVFTDTDGRGDFRLVVPIWDERTRM